VTIEDAIAKAVEASRQYERDAIKHDERRRVRKIIAAFLRAAEATEGMRAVGRAAINLRVDREGELDVDCELAAWRAMSSRMADEVEGGGG
jgi:hypothetical protein